MNIGGVATACGAPEWRRRGRRAGLRPFEPSQQRAPHAVHPQRVYLRLAHAVDAIVSRTAGRHRAARRRDLRDAGEEHLPTPEAPQWQLGTDSSRRWAVRILLVALEAVD
jgi:hypothetical protein